MLWARSVGGLNAGVMGKVSFGVIDLWRCCGYVGVFECAYDGVVIGVCAGVIEGVFMGVVVLGICEEVVSGAVLSVEIGVALEGAAWDAAICCCSNCVCICSSLEWK